MPATVRGVVTSNGSMASGSSGQISVTIPAAAVSGDGLYLIVSWNAGSSGAGTLRPVTGPSGWAQVGATITSASGTQNAATRMMIFSKAYATGMSGTVSAYLDFSTGNGASAWNMILVAVASGSVTPSANNVAATDAYSNLPSPFQITPPNTTSTDLALSIYGGNAATTGNRTVTYTHSAGWTVVTAGVNNYATYTQTSMLAANTTGGQLTDTVTPSEAVRGGIYGQLLIPAMAPTLSGKATLTGTATMAGSGVMATGGQGALSATGQVTAVGLAQFSANGTAALSGEATLSGSGDVHLLEALDGSADLSADATLAASGGIGVSAPDPVDPDAPPDQEAPPPEEAYEDLTPAPEPDEEQPVAATAHGTLTANEVKTVSVTAGRAGGVVVVNRNQQGVIWVRLDGISPVAEGAGSYAVFGAREFLLGRGAAFKQSNVSLLSDADRAYTVEGF